MKKIVFKIIQIALIVLWVLLLLKSTSFPFIYVIVGLGATAAVIWDKSRNTHKALTIIAGAILSICVVLANYGLFGSIFHGKILILLSAGVMLLGGFTAFANIAKFLMNCSEHKAWKQVRHKFRARTVWLFAAAVLTIVYCLVLFLGYYPGIISPDSVNQITQTYTGVYSNHHPFFHTMIIQLCMKAGLGIFGSSNAGVLIYSILQILIVACAFAYILMTLYQMELSYKFLIPYFVSCAVLPYNIFYSFTMWKDIIFGVAMAVFIAAAYRIMSRIGQMKAANYVLLALGGLGVCLFRSNGLIAFLVAFVVMIFVLGKKFRKMLIVLAGVLVLAVVLKGPVLNALNVSSADILESIAIPMQQIARVLADGEAITDEQREIISNVADPDKIAEYYTWNTVDSVKDMIRAEGNPDYIENNKGEFIKLYLQMACQHPVKFVEAWIDATKGYYNGGYDYWNWTVVNENEFGIERTTVSEGFAQAVEGYTGLYNTVWILQPFVSIGLCAWIIVLLLISCIAARRKAAVLAVPAIVIVLTLIVASPIYCEFRYAYSLFTCLPVITAAAFAGKAKAKESSR